MKIKKLYQILAFLGFIAVIVLIAVYQRYSLEKRHGKTVARIYTIESSSKGGDVVKYSFSLGQNEYSGTSVINTATVKQFQFLYTLLVNRKMSVVYEIGRPNNSDLLLRESEFKHFGVNPSDEEKKVAYKIDSLLD